MVRQGQGQVVEGKGQQGKAERPAALAAAAPYKMDKGGNPTVVGGTVMRYASKNKEKWDNRKAKVERLNTRAAVVLMLKGPVQGEKRKVEYKALEDWTLNNKHTPGASSALLLPTAASPSAPEKDCTDMFGSLTRMG